MPDVQPTSKYRHIIPTLIEVDGTPLVPTRVLAEHMQRPVHHIAKGQRRYPPLELAKTRLLVMQRNKLVNAVRVMEKPKPSGPTAPYFYTPAESAIALIADEAAALGLPALFVREIATACRLWGPNNPRPEELIDDVIPALAALVAAFEGRSYLMTQRIFVDPMDPTQRLVATLVRDADLPLPPGVEPGDRWIPRSAFTMELLGLLRPLALQVFSEPDPGGLQ